LDWRKEEEKIAVALIVAVTKQERMSLFPSTPKNTENRHDEPFVPNATCEKKRSSPGEKDGNGCMATPKSNAGIASDYFFPIVQQSPGSPMSSSSSCLPESSNDLDHHLSSFWLTPCVYFFKTVASMNLMQPRQQQGSMYSTSEAQQRFYAAKEEEIQATLAGHADTNRSIACAEESSLGVVDLWKLRYLALTPGGLLSSEWRKRAWPKLLACHDDVFQLRDTNTEGPELVEPSAEDLDALAFYVTKTLWNVEGHLLARREASKASEAVSTGGIQQEEDTNLMQRSPRRVTFSSLAEIAKLSAKTMTTSEEQGPAPHSTSHDHSADNSYDNLVLRSPKGSTERNAAHEMEDDDHTYDTSLTSSSLNLSNRVVRWQKASSSERKIIYSTIVALLRTKPEDCPFFEDDNYHFYRGLQDLTALLMINLESPSLTSLILAKLAQAHLRDPLRPDRNMLHLALSASVFPLLEMFDPTLFHYLLTQGVQSPSFCRQWVSCWFAQDVPNEEIASRLLDAFVVSHPVFPIYTSVALLTVHRERILQYDGEGASQMTHFLRHLPLQTLHEDVENRAQTVEIVISTAISYMEKMAPSDLLALVKRKKENGYGAPISTVAMINATMLPAASLLSKVPFWSSLDSAPTDWALVQNRRKSIAVEELNSGYKQTLASNHDDATRKKHRLALAALGFVPKQRNWFKRTALVVVLTVTFLVVAWKIDIAIHSKALAEITAMIRRQVPKPSSSASGVSQKGKRFHRVRTTLFQSAAQNQVTMQKSPSRKALPMFTSSKLQAKVVAKRTGLALSTRTAPPALPKATHHGAASVSGQPLPAKSQPAVAIWSDSLGVVSRKITLVWHALCRRFQRLVAKFAATS